MHLRGRLHAPVLVRHALILVLAGTAAPARAQCGPPRAPGEGPRVGLVLSGGGARGFAHVGVLRAFDEAGVRVDCVAGTSMGAVMGAFYASGYSVERIEEIVRSLDWQRVFSGRADRSLLPPGRRPLDLPPILRLGFEGRNLRLPSGALGDHRVNRMLIRELSAPSLASGGDFARLPIPFRAVALDIRTGERVMLATGDLARAVRASMSIPVAFAPVPWGERLLVDGGLVDNLPVSAARAMGAERVIAVDVTSPPREAGAGADALQVALQITDVLSQARNAAYSQPAEVTLRPDLEGLTFTDFGALDRFIRAGYDEARRRMDEVLADGPPAAPRAPRAAHSEAASVLDGQPLRAVEWKGLERVHPDVVRRLVPLREGQPLSLRGALRGLDALYASDLFRFSWLAFEREGDGVKAAFDVLEAQPWALELGGGYDEDDGARGFVRARQRNLFGHAERFQAELRAGDIEQAARARLIVDGLGALPAGLAVELTGLGDEPQVYDDGGRSLGRALFQQRRARLTLRREIARAWLLTAGLEAGSGEVRERPAVALAPSRDRVRLVHAGVSWDTADDTFEPERGGDVRAAFERSLPALGASRDAWRAALRARYVLSTAAVRLDAWAALSGGDVAPYDLFRLGGPELVPGRARDEQWGRQALAAALRVRRPLMGRLLAVARVGAGGVWRERRDVRLGDVTVGAGVGLEHPTPIGRLAWEYARHTGGGGGFYFSIGQRLPAPPHLGERP
jgi:NTE family protein